MSTPPTNPKRYSARVTIHLRQEDMAALQRESALENVPSGRLVREAFLIGWPRLRDRMRARRRRAKGATS